MFLKTEERPQGEVQQDEIGTILLRAADLIEKRGWCRWIQEEHDGSLCVAGAIVSAAGGIPARHDGNYSTYPILYAPAVRRFLSYVGDERGGPAPWNNDPDRTKEQVVAALRGAASQGL